MNGREIIQRLHEGKRVFSSAMVSTSPLWPNLVKQAGVDFVFVDTVAFTNNGIAQVRWVDLGADLRIEADINGDGTADMHILLQGAGAGVLTAADFVL